MIIYAGFIDRTTPKRTLIMISGIHDNDSCRILPGRNQPRRDLTLDPGQNYLGLRDEGLFGSGIQQLTYLIRLADTYAKKVTFKRQPEHCQLGKRIADEMKWDS